MEHYQLAYDLAKSNPWVALTVAAVVGIGGAVHHYTRQDAPARIVVNNQVVYDGTVRFRNDRIMFPLEFAQKAGVQAYYDPETNIAVLRQGNDNIAVKAETPVMLVFPSDGDRWLTEGEEALGGPFDPLRVPMETAPMGDDGQLLLPLRVIAAALQVDPNTVEWDNDTQTATINTTAPLAGPADACRSFSAPDFLKQAFDTEASSTPDDNPPTDNSGS